VAEPLAVIVPVVSLRVREAERDAAGVRAPRVDLIV
jgi:hypothetical protein